MDLAPSSKLSTNENKLITTISYHSYLLKSYTQEIIFTGILKI